MATGDKLVNLDDLKVVYDKVDGDVSNLKSATNANTYKTDCVADIVNKNRFNGQTVDGYLNADGSIHANVSGGDWVTTDYIFIEDFNTVVVSVENINTHNRVQLPLYFLCTYDKNKNIKSQKNNPTTYTVESGISYIRFSYHSNAAINVQVENNAISSYESYNEKAISAKVLELEDSIYNVSGKNLLDPSAIVDGYLNSNGTIHANPTGGDWKTTGFIDVRELDYITGSYGSDSRGLLGMYFFLNYDSNKSIVGSQINTATNPYQIPQNVAYIRFSYHSAVTNPMVEKGTAKTEYETYTEYKALRNSDYLRRSDAATIGHYNGIRWAVFGDSLTEKNIRANTSYYDYVAEELGCTIVNYGASGTGYARTNSNFMVRMANIDPDAFDVLTIFGSFNDAGAGLPIGEITDTTADTLCGCINITLDTFYAKAPYKPIGLVTPCPWIGIPPTNDFGNQYADAIIGIGKRRGIPVLDLFRESGIRPWAGQAYLEKYYKEGTTQDEGVHPNSLGHKVFLYPHFREFLKTLI